MSVVTAARLRPMCSEDVSWVMLHEPQLYPYPWSAGNFSDSLSAGYLCRILEVDGQAAGYAVMMLILDEAHLLNISVVAEHHGKGFGHLLLQRMCDEAHRAGACQCFLEVRPSNTPAVSLYERFGFTPIGRRRGYYPAPEGREDAVVMRLAL
ncbi:ribosomal protein S18-alanine N-acetyltransferase [Nitrogeniibacter aestuarii]|uniref:ribosomal protein S18-alanine N-acetyltransferase n=1 Tax=Nitrogeniibacter aestuarii TaxID=2815343 RepID=UPI001D100758|nr:ribosomal protein S18-alanine N-acetyltransferase [Nitrogeniibacter aestuarii]